MLPLGLLKKLAKPWVKKLGREVVKEIAQDALTVAEKKIEATVGTAIAQGQSKKSKGELLLAGAKWIVVLLLGLVSIGLVGIIAGAWNGQEYYDAIVKVLSALVDLF